MVGTAFLCKYTNKILFATVFGALSVPPPRLERGTHSLDAMDGFEPP